MHFMVACVQIGCSIFERKLIFLKCLFPWIVYKVDLQLIWYIYQETLRYRDWKIHRGTYCNVANRPLIMMLNHFKVCFIAFSHNPKRQTPSSVSIFLCLPRSSEIGWGQKWIGPQKKTLIIYISSWRLFLLSAFKTHVSFQRCSRYITCLSLRNSQ